MCRQVPWSATVLLFIGSAFAANPAIAQNQPATYDGYIAGVRVAELTISGAGAARSYSLKKKDFKTNQWSAAVTAPEAKVAADNRFELWGSIKGLPGKIADLQKLDWTSLKSVGWPEADNLYLRHREQKETVNGRPVTAWYWAQRDATRPMDLVFGTDNRLVAGIDVSGDVVLVRRGYERFTTVSRWNDPKMSPAKYGYKELGKFMVKSTDGIGLATLVYLPDGAIQGPFPTVFIRTPYGIGAMISQYWYYAARGYALVFQAARGTNSHDPGYVSEGEFGWFTYEARDGAEGLKWITQQSWSNGKVCMQGGSYVAFTQWNVSIADNPALKCLVPESSMGTVFSDQPYMGGGFVEGLAYYMFWMLDLPILPERNWTEILHHRPLADIDAFATGKDLPQWNAFFEHWRNDDYWKVQDWYRAPGKRDFASLQISGWFDDDRPGTEANWAHMQRGKTQPHRLLLGPWRHGYNNDRMLNGFSFGQDALRDDIRLLKQRWYDRFLKDIDNGVDKPVVEYFVLGDNNWRQASQWPPENAQPQIWYFHSNGQANRFLTDGSLTTTPPPTEEKPDRYRYDPRVAVANWMSFEQMMRWEDVQTYPWDFKDIEARPDVVTFTSAPLTEDLTIAGNIVADLYASTDAKDTDWWVHVSDVDQSGRSIRLVTGMLRARFRNLDDPEYHMAGSNFQKEDLLSGNPDEVVRYKIRVHSLANTFKKGHRVRVAITNAMDNYSFPNSNTGGNEGEVTQTVVGSMAVHHGPGRASSIVLPVVPKLAP